MIKAYDQYLHETINNPPKFPQSYEQWVEKNREKLISIKHTLYIKESVK